MASTDILFFYVYYYTVAKPEAEAGMPSYKKKVNHIIFFNCSLFCSFLIINWFMDIRICMHNVFQCKFYIHEFFTRKLNSRHQIRQYKQKLIKFSQITVNSQYFVPSIVVISHTLWNLATPLFNIMLVAWKLELHIRNCYYAVLIDFEPHKMTSLMPSIIFKVSLLITTIINKVSLMPSIINKEKDIFMTISSS